MDERRILLDPDTSPDVFRAVADDAGWELIKESPPTGLLALELIYRPEGEDMGTIHYIEDSYIKVRYAITRGQEADALAEDLMERVAYAPVEGVVEAAEDEDEGLQHMVSWMLSATALEGETDPEWLHALLEKRLAHENSGVRRAGLIAVTWLEWPEFRATVERMAKDDPDDDVRAEAANLAKAYAAPGSGEA